MIKTQCVNSFLTSMVPEKVKLLINYMMYTLAPDKGWLALQLVFLIPLQVSDTSLHMSSVLILQKRKRPSAGVSRL
jgi:hypothetical protein